LWQQEQQRVIPRALEPKKSTLYGEE